MSTALTLASAVAALREGGVIAYPTEAVWGLGCAPADETAVTRLLAIKQRPLDKGLILIADGLDALHPWIDIDAVPEPQRAAVLASWPGPHTWILPARPGVPRWVRGEHAGVAVRVSAHDPVRVLCAAFGGALVSTSANLSGEPPARSAEALSAPLLLARIDGYLPGQVGRLAEPTPIRDALSGAILRA